MMTILSDAALEIKNWNNIRNNIDVADAFLSQGYYFKIERNEYEYWKSIFQNHDILEEKRRLHAYLGASCTDSSDGVLSFFLLDSYTDSLPVDPDDTSNYSNSLRKKTYDKAVLENSFFNDELLDINELDIKSYLHAIVRWTLSKKEWMGVRKKNGKPMARILDIPFSDLDTLFSLDGETGTPIDSIVCQPSLSNREGHKTGALLMDLTLWGYTPKQGLLGKKPEDLIRPVPPFSHNKADYQLLLHANAAL